MPVSRLPPDDAPPCWLSPAAGLRLVWLLAGQPTLAAHVPMPNPEAVGLTDECLMALPWSDVVLGDGLPLLHVLIDDHQSIEGAGMVPLRILNALLERGVPLDRPASLYVHAMSQSLEATALTHAVLNGYEDQVKALLAAGAQVNAVSEFGYTALELLLRITPNSPLVCCLLEAGAYAAPSASEEPFLLQRLLRTITSNNLRSLLVHQSARLLEVHRMDEYLVAASYASSDAEENVALLRACAAQQALAQVVQGPLPKGTFRTRL